MGRRPNSLVVEFFDRGEKLGDSSNRYKHTCKKCGELFPKGRSDSLNSHLLRKCPNVTQEDRQWVFQQIQRTPERPSDPPATLMNGLFSDSPKADLSPYSPVQDYQRQSALETLAEVSRRHLDYSSKRVSSGAFLEQPHNESINEQDLVAQLQDLNSSQSTDLSLTATSALAASPLVQTASAANQQLELAQTQSGSLVDRQLHNMRARLPAQGEDADKVDSNAGVVGWNSETVLGPQQTFGNVSMPWVDSTSTLGLLQKARKQKTRSHFNDARRKEVQEIRKRGACIRCRMLKKSCSGETPCGTCRNVESARIWRGTCIRTRLAEEFGLWSAKLFYSKAKAEISAALYDSQPIPPAGRLEARFTAASDLWLSFAAIVHRDISSGAEPTVQNGFDTVGDETKDIWLMAEEGAMSDKIEAYANGIAEDFINSEPNQFMRATLQKARDFVGAEDRQSGRVEEMHEDRPPRASYKLQDQLLKNVVKLWVLTRLLTLSDGNQPELRYNLIQPSQHLPGRNNGCDKKRSLSIMMIASSSRSHVLIRAQLYVAIEACCSKLSKTVMNELERRLLQRQQVSRFGTFLSAVILLNSVERMTGFYRCLDTDERSAGHSQLQLPCVPSGTAPENTDKSAMEAAWGNISYLVTDHPTFWPLDNPPSALWPQGPYFAELLTMLLRMRALPPKISQTPDGALVVVQDCSIPVHVNGQLGRAQNDDQTEKSAALLDPLKLGVAELLQKRDGQLPRSDSQAEEWDMRFVAKVLLPESLR